MPADCGRGYVRAGFEIKQQQQLGSWAAAACMRARSPAESDTVAHSCTLLPASKLHL
jgi:hypothetical protein